MNSFALGVFVYAQTGKIQTTMDQGAGQGCKGKDSSSAQQRCYGPPTSSQARLRYHATVSSQFAAAPAADALEEARPGDEAPLLKRLLSLSSSATVTAVSQLDTDKVTDFAAYQQRVQVPTVPRGFRFHFPRSMTEIIVTSVGNQKLKKSPAPDKIRADMLRLTAHPLAEVCTALWSAVGRLGHMPSVLRSGWFAPIYENGNP